MALDVHSNPFIYYAFWSGVTACSISLLIICVVIALRIFLLIQERSQQQLLELWRPLIAKELSGDQVKFPELSKNMMIHFLHLWLHFQESIRGDSKQKLNQLLHNKNLLPLVHQKLLHGLLQHQLIAAAVIGHARYQEAWDDLVMMARNRPTALSMVSARALMMIDAERSTSIVIPLLVKRRDWSYGKLSAMLKEVDPIFLTYFMIEVSEAAKRNEPYLIRLLHLVEAFGHKQHFPFVTDLLKNSDKPEIVASCLRMLNDPNSIDLVRTRVDDKDFGVRVQVAKTLKRLGTINDVAGLLKLLQSPEWWVRYRAAEALVTSPFITSINLLKIQSELKDKFAIDMLHQAMSKKRML